MKPTILKRLADLESRPSKRPAVSANYEDTLISETGLTKEAFLAKYGSVPNYSYLRMVFVPEGPPEPLHPRFAAMTPSQVYMAMLDEGKGKNAGKTRRGLR